MPAYKIEAAVAANEVNLRVSFGDPAQNDTIVRDAEAALAALNLSGGPLVKVNGPASLPVAMVLAHRLGHIFGVVACYDPKLPGSAKYVVTISHDPAMKVGDLIE